ncbi:MAG: hypothetical protein FDX18_04235 [Chlorobium sp.]|nr:MAG: hypothetical protein FDX18_04235 [Chlorobium sp.]
MDGPIDFIQPRLVGERFAGHAIPLEILKDLAVLEELIIETAKWRFRNEHPERKRIPKGFTKGISLQLTAIDEGSAIAKISLSIATFAGMTLSLFPAESQNYLIKAKESIVSAVNAAEQDVNSAVIKTCLSDNLLSYFDRIGRSLREGEAIELNPSDTNNPGRINKVTRRKLLLSSSQVQELTEEITLRGTIPEVDQDKMSFELQIISGPKVTGPITPQHRQTIMDAFNRYCDKAKVLLQGIGRYDRNSRLQCIESIEHINILDTNDVAAQLDEFRSLQVGWMDGKGLAPGKDGLDRLAERFDLYYSEELPLPYIYPTTEGGVQAEWTLGSSEITLEINLDTLAGEWHSLNMITNEQNVRTLQLESVEEWSWINQTIQKLSEEVA